MAAQLVVGVLVRRALGGPGSGWTAENGHVPGSQGGIVDVNEPAFKAWFDKSAVVDKQGDPLVVYHGSVNIDFDEFDPNVEPVRARSGPNGVYFTSDSRSASNYTRRPGAGIKAPPGRVHAAYLSLQNPLDITKDVARGQRKGLSFGESKREALKALKPEHDGVVFRGDRANPDEYIAFKSSSIKRTKLALIAAATNKLTPVHHAADAHAPKFSVALRYAFARARAAINVSALRSATTQSAALQATAKMAPTLRRSLEEVLPQALHACLSAGGAAGVQILQGKLAALGGSGSGWTAENGHVPGSQGGSAGQKLEALKQEHGEIIPVEKVFASRDQEGEALAVYGNMDTSKDGQVRAIDPRELIATQDDVDATGLQHYLKGTGQSKEKPIILKLNGKHFIVEGHHRVGAHLLNKKESILVEQYDGDAFINSAEGQAALGKFMGLRTAKKGDKPIRVAPLKFAFDAKDKAAIKWARKHTGGLIDDLTQTSIKRVKRAIVQALEGRHTLEDAADAILEEVGDIDRAELIAHHETMLAASEGQRQSWDQAVEKGLLTGKEKRSWITVGDGKVCPICEELDGATADLDGKYPEPGGDGPPQHVECRCTEGISA